MYRPSRGCIRDFNPRSPRGERLFFALLFHFITQDFNPRSPRGERHSLHRQAGAIGLFQPTLPAWGATVESNPFNLPQCVFQPTLPAWGATSVPALCAAKIDISTHAPRVGSDPVKSSISISFTISTHAPRVGSDLLPRDGRCTWCISTHAPRVGSDIPLAPRVRVLLISTHAPHVGSDTQTKAEYFEKYQFQPTLPAWGATLPSVTFVTSYLIFQPTLPAWGATFPVRKLSAASGISTHAPRVGSDESASLRVGAAYKFQPTLPAWGATSRWG